MLCRLRISHSLVPSGPFGTVSLSRWFQQRECLPSLGHYWRALLTTEPSCALNVQVFFMYSLWNNFDVSCLTLASLSWPNPAALLKWTVNRTLCHCALCIIPLFEYLPVCKCFSAPAFWLTAQQNDFDHREQCNVCLQQFGFETEETVHLRLTVDNSAKCKESGETKMERGGRQRSKRIKQVQSRASVKVNKLSLCTNNKGCQKKRMENNKRQY